MVAHPADKTTRRWRAGLRQTRIPVMTTVALAVVLGLWGVIGAMGAGEQASVGRQVLLPLVLRQSAAPGPGRNVVQNLDDDEQTWHAVYCERKPGNIYERDNGCKSEWKPRTTVTTQSGSDLANGRALVVGRSGGVGANVLVQRKQVNGSRLDALDANYFVLSLRFSYSIPVGVDSQDVQAIEFGVAQWLNAST